MQEDIKYELIIYWSEDDEAYIVEVPELPGVPKGRLIYA